ncbi:MAG TPA: rod shape-determining protein RodA [Candidatus Bathyarchaeia archaeon]|nr:rod shape-determining protein RodA [Candidatus Bathyarchaeia archaeon]
MPWSPKIDWLIVGLVLLIFSFGSLILFSLDPQFFRSQLIYFLLGTLLFIIFSSLDYRVFKDFYPHLFIFSIFFLCLTFILGQLTRGTIRWIKIGNFTLQPSELVKPMLVLSFSGFALNLDTEKIKNFFLLLLIFFLPAFLVFKQPALGSSLIVFLTWLGILVAKGIDKKYILIGLFLFLAVLPLIWHFLKPYQQERIVSFINPGYDPLGSGYNLAQAKIAIGSGQFLGKGLGQGSQSQLHFLPERHSDFIFACLAEEMGFIGGTVVIGAFLALILKIIQLGQKSVEGFGSLICYGTAAMIFSQVFVNIGMNLGLLPVTGITLPLVSYGGSSLMSTLILLGFIESISKNIQKEKMIEIR